MSAGGYFNVETGAMRDDPTSDTSEASAPASEPAQTFAEKVAASYGVPRPATPTLGGLTRAGAQLQADAIRAAADTDPLHPLRDERHAAHEETVAHYLALNTIAAGDREHVDIEILGDEPARGREPSERPPVQVPTLSNMAREAGYDWNARQVQALSALADESGLPRYHVDVFLQDMAASAEAEAVAGEGSTREAARADLIRREGHEGAQQTIRDAQAFVTLLGESDHAVLMGASEDIAALSRNAQVVIGAARLYRELSSLADPRGPWAELLLGRGARWAKEQAAGKARAAQAQRDTEAEGDEARAGFMDDTAARHAQWGKAEP